MDWADNEYAMYSDKIALFDVWVEQGDAWDKDKARQEALALARHFAEAIESSQEFESGDKYSKTDLEEAADQMIEEFDEHLDYAIKEKVELATRVPKKEDFEMDAGEIEYTKKMEQMVLKYGKCIWRGEAPENEEQIRKHAIEFIRGYIPVGADKVRQALERGDKHLNTIKLRKWDAQAEMMGYRNCRMSLSDMTGLLKHVAKWHYA